MTVLAMLLITLGLLAVAGLHVYWAGGGEWARDAVVPQRADGAPLFEPSELATLAVSLTLALVIMLAVAAYINIGGMTINVLLGLIGLLFVARAVGEFHYFGFFKTVKDTAFAWWDTRLFAPLSLAVGLSCVYVAMAKGY